MKVCMLVPCAGQSGEEWIVTLVTAADVRASSVPAVEAWLRVGEGVGEAPGESRPQICSSSRRPAVDDE